jgi:hypothetical protein
MEAGQNYRPESAARQPISRIVGCQTVHQRPNQILFQCACDLRMPDVVELRFGDASSLSV